MKGWDSKRGWGMKSKSRAGSEQAYPRLKAASKGYIEQQKGGYAKAMVQGQGIVVRRQGHRTGLCATPNMGPYREYLSGRLRQRKGQHQQGQRGGDVCGTWAAAPASVPSSRKW